MTSKTLQHKIEYNSVKFLMFVLNLFPLKLALRFGDFIGFIAFSVLKIRRKVALANLKNSLGDLHTKKEYRKIALKSYINFARSMIEFALFPKISNMNIANMVKVENEEFLNQHFKTGHGAIIVSGHFGNFELAGVRMVNLGWPIYFLVGKQRNLMVNDLMNHNRSLFNVGLIEIGVAARGVFTALKKGRGVAMLSDQDTGKDGVIVDFLGRPASTPKGPAAFALKTDCPLFAFFMVRDGLAGHRLFLEGPITIKKSDDKEKDIKRLTQAYTDIIAKYVIRYPEYYFWAHRRWKSTCPDEYQ